MIKVEKLKLTDVRKKLPFNINYGLGAFRMKDILDENRGYELDFDVYLPSKNKNLQRPFVWTLFQKQQLILSILKGIRIPTVTLIHYEHKIFKVIDGKQRLSTWISFMKNEFPVIYNDQEFYYKDLDADAQYEFMYSYITADVGYEYEDVPISDNLKIQWFEMINFAGTPQDLEHLKYLKE